MTHQPGATIRDLSIDLDEFHLRDIQLEVGAGEYFVILGPTGAGKTVFLEALAGLQVIQSGQIILAGQDVTHLAPERRKIGFVYQDYALFPHLSAADNIAFGLKMVGVDRRTITQRVQQFSTLLGIDTLLHRRPDTLSGGEQQRVALARALAVQPALLLLDEPLSALDPGTREILQREMTRLHRELGTTTIHVTHDFEEAVALGDRIAVMNEGRIVQVGTPEQIFREPNSKFTAQFVGVRNILQGEVKTLADGSGVLTCEGLEIVVATELRGPVHASIRPEEFILSREPLISSARNTFKGRIICIEDRGTLVYITVDIPPRLVCVATRTSVEDLCLQSGEPIHLAFKASAVNVF